MIRTVAVAAALVGVAAEGVAVSAATSGAARWAELSVAAVIIAWVAVGLVIVWHRPRHPVGRLAVTAGFVWGIGQGLLATSARQLQAHPTPSAALGMVLGGALRGLPWLVLVLWLPVRFPDGTPADTTLSRRSERLVVVAITLFTAVALFAPTLSYLELPGVANPIGLPPSWQGAVDASSLLALLLGITSIALGVACLVQRYRRGGALTRQQVLVFSVAFIPPVVALVLSALTSAPVWVFGVCTLPLPLAVGVAVLSRRLYDLPLVLNRTLTYGILWLAIAALYAVVVGGVGAALRAEDVVWLPWLAAGVVAVSFAPLRDALQRGANRLTYGQWAQPAEVLAAGVRRLGDAADVPGLLQSLVDDLGSGLSLRFLALTARDGGVLASHGTAIAEVDELPVFAYGSQVAVLTWARRPLRDSDRALLHDLAAQLGSIVHSVELVDALRASQERLVTAGEEERRRLRRDLHDGLGPALAALSLRVDTLRNHLDGSSDAAVAAGLLELRSAIQATVADVRRVVEGLRPPALDELGLVDSITELASRLSASSGVDIEVRAQRLAPLGAATEVACYRIVQEALTNVVRHAGASRARVWIGHERHELRVCVSDDGDGVRDERPTGVGLASMRERAEEIGGTFLVEGAPGRGARVVATLPLEQAVGR